MSVCRHPSLIFSVECAAQIAFTFCLWREIEGEECCQSIFQLERREGPPRASLSLSLSLSLSPSLFLSLPLSLSRSLSLSLSLTPDMMGSFEADKCPGRCSLINALSGSQSVCSRPRPAGKPFPSFAALPRKAEMHLGLVSPSPGPRLHALAARSKIPSTEQR